MAVIRFFRFDGRAATSSFSSIDDDDFFFFGGFAHSAHVVMRAAGKFESFHHVPSSDVSL